MGNRKFALVAWACWIIIVPSICLGADSDEELHFDEYLLGVTIRHLEANDFLIADVPMIRARVPLGSDVVQLGYGGHLMWGLTEFFVDWTFAGGIHVFPFGKSFSFNATAHLGSFLLDNVTYMGAIGVHFDIPTGDDTLVSFGAEYFHRNSRELLDWIEFPQVSHSSFGPTGRDEAIHLDSSGVGFSIAFRY